VFDRSLGNVVEVEALRIEGGIRTNLLD